MEIGRRKRVTFLLTFLYRRFGDSFWREKNARLERELNFSRPFSKIQTYIAREYDRMTRKGRYVIVSNYFWSL